MPASRLKNDINHVLGQGGIHAQQGLPDVRVPTRVVQIHDHDIARPDPGPDVLDPPPVSTLAPRDLEGAAGQGSFVGPAVAFDLGGCHHQAVSPADKVRPLDGVETVDGQHEDIGERVAEVAGLLGHDVVGADGAVPPELALAAVALGVCVYEVALLQSERVARRLVLTPAVLGPVECRDDHKVLVLQDQAARVEAVPTLGAPVVCGHDVLGRLLRAGLGRLVVLVALVCFPHFDGGADALGREQRERDRVGHGVSTCSVSFYLFSFWSVFEVCTLPPDDEYL